MGSLVPSRKSWVFGLRCGNLRALVGPSHPLPVTSPTHVHADTGNRKGSLSDLLQEKASPGRDPALENLLESTKDWSDYGHHRE